MKRSILTGLTVLGALLAFGAEAQACDVSRLTLVGGGVSGRYDPIAATDGVLNFRLNGPADADCAGLRAQISAYVDVGQTAPANGFLRLENGPATLVSRILDQTGRSNTRGTDALFRGTYPMDGAGSINPDLLTLRLPRGQSVPPGIYQNRFRLVIEALDAGGAMVDTAEISGLAVVEVGALVSLSASWGTDLDLGEIRSGGRSVAPIRFRAYANTPYEIAVESDNHFQLLKNGDASAERIAYVPVLSDAVLATGEMRTRDFGQPSSGYRDHSLDVEVPALGVTPAGEYRDFMTVRIRAVVGG